MTKINIDYNKNNVFTINNYKIKYKGLIFYKSILNGRPSLEAFINDYKDKWLNHIEELNGNFILDVTDNKNEYIFTDNSGMSRLYYYKDKIFESFLDLIETLKPKQSDLDYSGLVEFIQYGYNIFHTNIKNANILKRNEYIICNKFEVKEKKLSNFFTKNINIEDFYKNLKDNFKDKKIACDLTAGIDSRLNVSLLKGNNIDFVTSISGQENHIDVIKCKEISSILNLDNLYYPMDKKYNKDIIKNLYEELDGQYSILEFYKNYVLTKGLINDGIELRISGAAGELYKYSWYAQDFPHFNKKSFSLNDVYQKRFFSRNVKYDIYSETFKKEISNYQQELKEQLEMYREENNVKTYDRICYETIMRYGISTQLIPRTDNYIRYCPLFELSVVKSGINLKPNERLLYSLHRKMITKYTKEISKIKTNKGLTVSNSIFSIISDGFKLFEEFLTKIKNRIIKKNITKVDSANSNKIFEYMKKNDDKYIKILEKNNIISKNINKEKIDLTTYSRLITIALFIERITNE